MPQKSPVSDSQRDPHEFIEGDSGRFGQLLRHQSARRLLMGLQFVVIRLGNFKKPSRFVLAEAVRLTPGFQAAVWLGASSQGHIVKADYSWADSLSSLFANLFDRK